MNTSKRNSFFPISPMSSALMCPTAATRDKPGPLAKGAFSSEGDKDTQKEAAQCKSQQQPSQCCVVEEFFWLGSSLMAFSKWRLGYMGKLCPIPWVELDWLDIKDASLLWTSQKHNTKYWNKLLVKAIALHSNNTYQVPDEVLCFYFCLFVQLD